MPRYVNLNLTRAFATLSFVACASSGNAQMVVDVPSGQSVTLLEKRVELDADIVRLRFIAPDLASPLTRPSFEALGEDLEALCSEFGLKVLLKDSPLPAQIVVSLSAEELEFGVSNTEVEQVFEAFSVQNDTCMLEMF
jgi:hypothetical protein